MDLLTSTDLQALILVRVCLFFFVIMGISMIYRWKSSVGFLIGTGILSALSYLAFVDDMGALLWGLQGDEVTIAAMYQTVASHSFWSDFAYHHLPPFYPPLFFWIFGYIGRIYEWNGIQIAKFSAAITIALLPILLYAVQRWYTRVTTVTEEEKKWIPGVVTAFLFPLCIYVVIDWDAIIMKPYQVSAAALSILWTMYVGQDAYYRRLTIRRIMVYGVGGGILFMTYYLWLVFGVLALVLFALTVPRTNQWYYYGRLAFVGVLVLVCASPFIVPLALSYREFGTENFQLGYFTFENMRLEAVMFELFSWRGMVLLGGFIALIHYRRATHIRILLSFFLSSYVWYAIGLFGLLFFAASNQEFKGFYFPDRTILALGFAYGVERWWRYIDGEVRLRGWKKTMQIVGLVFLATQMFFGFFVNNPEIIERRHYSRVVDPYIQGVAEFMSRNPVSDGDMVLHAGIAQLYALVPINTFVYHLQHNSHPAARFSDRMLYLEEIARASTSEEFYHLLTETPYGSIGRLIFFLDHGQEGYTIYYDRDNFPHAGKMYTITIKKELFEGSGIEKVYENDRFVVFDVKKRE
jgi:galactan 5-O-arabinofuranosyltransferase